MQQQGRKQKRAKSHWIGFFRMIVLAYEAEGERSFALMLSK
jgi:hypothetical protein